MKHSKHSLNGLAACFVLAAGVLVVAGCAESKKKPGASPNTTDGVVIEEEEIIIEEVGPAKTADDEKDMPESKAEPSEALPLLRKNPPLRKSPPEEKPAADEQADARDGRVVLGSDELFAGIPGTGELSIEAIEAWLVDPRNLEPLDFVLPMGMAKGATEIKGVDKNPLTRAKIELGRQLYFDPRLSADETIACATCHDPDEGFARHTQFGVGIKGQTGGRNSPVSYNRILSDKQFWDGRADSLEAQAVGPIANPIEMGHTHEACVAVLADIPGYRMQFDKIFGRLDIDAVGEALASFERAVVTGPAPFDYAEALKPFEDLDQETIEDNEELKKRYDEAMAGAKAHPLTDSAKRGMELYFSEKASCSACHVGANLTDEKYHNLGVGMDQEKPDVGRFEVTKDEKDIGAFKTPTIRNVASRRRTCTTARRPRSRKSSIGTPRGDTPIRTWM